MGTREDRASKNPAAPSRRRSATRPKIDAATLARAAELQADRSPMDMAGVQAALGLKDRTSLHYMRNGTRNYTRGGLDNWPLSSSQTRRARPPVGPEVPTLTDWAPHPAVLPVPDIDDGAMPLWYAGTIYTWAMQTGRMTLTGEPLWVAGRGPVRAPGRQPHPELPKVDWARYEELVSDETLWTITDITAAAGVGHAAGFRWYAATREYMASACREWPPPKQIGEAAGKGRALADWPTHPRLLPPPDAVDEEGVDRWYPMAGGGQWHAKKRLKWKAGKARLFLMRTGRMALDGTPLAHTA